MPKNTTPTISKGREKKHISISTPGLTLGLIIFALPLGRAGVGLPF